MARNSSNEKIHVTDALDYNFPECSVATRAVNSSEISEVPTWLYTAKIHIYVVVDLDNGERGFITAVATDTVCIRNALEIALAPSCPGQRVPYLVSNIPYLMTLDADSSKREEEYYVLVTMTATSSNPAIPLMPRSQMVLRSSAHSTQNSGTARLTSGWESPPPVA